MIERLFRLQMIDRRLKEIEQAELDQSNLRKLVELKQREKAEGIRLEQMDWRVKGFKHRIKQGEDEVEELVRQIEEYREKLYNGAERGTKELEHMQSKYDNLCGIKERLEKDLFDVMMEVEELDQELTQIRQEYEQMQKECALLETEYKEYRQNLRKEAKRLHVARGREVLAIPAELYQQYLRSYEQHEGVAIAKVKDSRCTGCQVRISAEVLSKVRTNDELQHCEMCGRILYYQESNKVLKSGVH